MKLQIETLAMLVMFIVILFVGCNGDEQKPPPQVEPGTDTQEDVTLSPEVDTETTFPTTFYPPENPYEDLTVTRTAPPSGYNDYDFFWIPEFEYELEPGEMPVKYKDYLPIAPKHVEKMARFRQHEIDFYDKLEEKLKNVTSEKLMRKIVKEDEVN